MLQYFVARARQNELRVNFARLVMPPEASWTLHLILVLLYAVGFEGDDDEEGKHESVAFRAAVHQAQYLLDLCVEGYELFKTAGCNVTLDFADYDLNNTVGPYFGTRASPEKFNRIRPSVPKENILGEEAWNDVERIVEGALLAAQRIAKDIHVEVNEDEVAIAVERANVLAIVGEMVNLGALQFPEAEGESEET